MSSVVNTVVIVLLIIIIIFVGVAVYMSFNSNYRITNTRNNQIIKSSNEQTIKDDTVHTQQSTLVREKKSIPTFDAYDGVIDNQSKSECQNLCKVNDCTWMKYDADTGNCWLRRN